MRIGRFLAATAMATVASLFVSAAAYAATVTLNPDHVGETAAGFPTKDCSGPLGSPPAPTGWDGWHFVLPNASGEDLDSVTIVFSGGVTATITSHDENAPSTGSGYSGYIDNAGDSEKHVYIFTNPTGQSIVSGTGETSNGGTQTTFNLSHTCPGVASPSPSPSRSIPPLGSPSPETPPSAGETPPGGTPTPVASVPSGPARTGGGGSQGGGLGWFGVAAAMIVALPVAAALIQRRRHP